MCHGYSCRGCRGNIVNITCTYIIRGYYLWTIDIPLVQVVIDSNTWNIPSISGKSPDGYLVKQIKVSCAECSSTTEDIQTTCTQSECKQLCYYMYTCGMYCYDYTNGNLCKHIHRAHSVWLKLQDPNHQSSLQSASEGISDGDSDINDPLEFAENVRNPSSGTNNYAYTHMYSVAHRF